MSKSHAGDSAPEKNPSESAPSEGQTGIKDFEDALARLEVIVRRLEGGELSLEESMKLFEQGIQLSSFCSARLDEAERRVEILVKGAKGSLEVRPFEAGEENGGD